MAYLKGRTKTYFDMTVAGGAPLEIAKRCGVRRNAVTQWLARNREEVEAGKRLYRERLIDSLVYARLQRVLMEDAGLTVSDSVNNAALPPRTNTVPHNTNKANT